MKYQLDFLLNHLKVYRPTAEKHDEIYMTGFGMNEFGKIDVLPHRRIYSNEIGSFTTDENVYDSESDTVYGNTLIGGNPLISTILPDRRHLNYQVWLWIIESDDVSLLREKHRFNKQGLENLVEDAVRELSRRGYLPKSKLYFQAMANEITNIHHGMRTALFGTIEALGIMNGAKFQVFTPITLFINCNKFLNLGTPKKQLADLEPGEYNIDLRVNSDSFNLVNSSEDYLQSRYSFSHEWNLIVSGTPKPPAQHL